MFVVIRNLPNVFWGIGPRHRISDRLVRPCLQETSFFNREDATHLIDWGSGSGQIWTSLIYFTKPAKIVI